MSTPTLNKLSATRRSPAQWQAIMSAYNASGLTQEAFCIQQALAPSTFYAWRKRLRSQPENVEDKPLFIDVTAPAEHAHAPRQPDWDVELSLGNGTVLRLRHLA